MNKFKILLAMQLKEKLNLTFLKSKKQTLFKLVFSLLGFFVVAAVAYVIFFLCELINLFSVATYIPLSVMTLIFSIIIAFSIFTCTLGLSKTLFYAKDNQTIVTLPLPANQIYLSKMLVYYIGEIKRTLTFTLPIFYAYGFISGLAPIFYVWAPVMLSVFTAIPVLIGGLLSIPMMFVIAFFKKFPIIKFIIFAGILGLLVFVVVKLIYLIPTNINLISSWKTVAKWSRNILNWCTVNLSAVYSLCLFLCGKVSFMNIKFFTYYSWSVLLIILTIILALVIVNLVVSRPIYLKLISKQFEFKRKEIEVPKFNLPRTKFWSTSVYEAKKTIRDMSILSNTVMTLIVAPITILLINKIYAAINTRLLGDYLAITFNILIISLFTLAHNIKTASIYSKDGDALLIGKTKPATPFVSMFPRLMYNFITTAMIVMATMACFVSISSITITNGILLGLAILFIAFAHIVWCADIDFNKPQIALFRTEGADANSPNEIKSTILTFAIAGIFTAVTMLLLIKSANYVWIKICLAAFAFFVLRLALFTKKLKLLYKEM